MRGVVNRKEFLLRCRVRIFSSRHVVIIFPIASLAMGTFDVVAEDGIPLLAARTGLQQILIAPAKRIEVVVRASTTAAKYALSLQSYDHGEDIWPVKPLATVVITGNRWTGASVSGVDTSHQLEDLRLATALKRQIH